MDKHSVTTKEKELFERLKPQLYEPEAQKEIDLNSIAYSGNVDGEKIVTDLLNKKFADSDLIFRAIKTQQKQPEGTYTFYSTPIPTGKEATVELLDEILKTGKVSSGKYGAWDYWKNPKTGKLEMVMTQEGVSASDSFEFVDDWLVGGLGYIMVFDKKKVKGLKPVKYTKERGSYYIDKSSDLYAFHTLEPPKKDEMSMGFVKEFEVRFPEEDDQREGLLGIIIPKDKGFLTSAEKMDSDYYLDEFRKKHPDLPILLYEKSVLEPYPNLKRNLRFFDSNKEQIGNVPLDYSKLAKAERESQKHFQEFRKYLDNKKLPYEVKKHLEIDGGEYATMTFEKFYEKDIPRKEKAVHLYPNWQQVIDDTAEMQKNEYKEKFSNENLALMIKNAKGKRDLSSWEIGFLNNVEFQLKGRGFLSPKQKDLLEKISERKSEAKTYHNYGNKQSWKKRSRYV